MLAVAMRMVISPTQLGLSLTVPIARRRCRLHCFDFFGTRFFGLGATWRPGIVPTAGPSISECFDSDGDPRFIHSIRIFIKIPQKDLGTLQNAALRGGGTHVRELADLVKRASQSRSFPHMRRRTELRPVRETSSEQVARKISARRFLYRQPWRFPFR